MIAAARCVCRAAASGDPRSLIRIIRGELIRVVNTYYTARSRAVFAKSQPGKIATARMDTMLVCTGVCIHGVTTRHYRHVYKSNGLQAISPRSTVPVPPAPVPKTTRG